MDSTKRMIAVKGESTIAKVYGSEEMFDEVFFNQVQEIVDHESMENDIRIMPDGHAGAGAVIGFTMEVGDKLTPNLVGSDIGCGVTAVNVGTHSQGEMWTPKQADEKVREAVPMGLGVTHDNPDYHIVNDFPWSDCQKTRRQFDLDFTFDVEYGKEYLLDLCKRVGLDLNNVISSMGTLGSGNHFFEISRGNSTGDVWLVVHSGSRCVGGAVSSYWQEKATESIEGSHILKNMENWMWDYVKFTQNTPLPEIRQWVLGGKGEAFYDMQKIRENFEGVEIEETRQRFVSLQPNTKRNKELDYLEGDDVEGYITDMIFAQKYARENRKTMIRDACEALNFEMGDMIDSIHNYIDFADNTVRKGATRSHEGERLVIPFNMAEGSVICRGKGNRGWNRSAPHGAGRRGSRTWAYDEFDVQQFNEELGRVYSSNDEEEVLDEIPSAYKSSDNILNHLPHTAEVEEFLTPIVNMKGE